MLLPGIRLVSVDLILRLIFSLGNLKDYVNKLLIMFFNFNYYYISHSSSKKAEIDQNL